MRTALLILAEILFLILLGQSRVPGSGLLGGAETDDSGAPTAVRVESPAPVEDASLRRNR